MKNKFIVKTEDRKRIKVEGELLNNNSSPSKSLGKPRNKQPTLRDLVVNINTRLGTIDTRLDTIDTRLDTIDTRLDTIDTRLDTIDTRLERMENTPTMKNELNKLITK